MMKLNPPLSFRACVVGSGAAGYSAALRLSEYGVPDVAILTEGVLCGTSRNTGSDKQTYYKLSLAGDRSDSVAAMARDLFAGGCVDGDNALSEAALSARCFLRLCELGVPFPTDEYGQYVGYKTDHDPAARATSAGPLTSRLMTEVLERETERRSIPVYDHMTAVRIVKDGDGAVCGLLALDMSGTVPTLTPVICPHIVWATGGPAGIYADTVYPVCHTGTTGVPLEAGAAVQNATEWQYGLASVRPRWNMSGTYMQVLPRLYSVGADGTEHEFLSEMYTPAVALSLIFLKGYQWPFDCKKLSPDGVSQSSLVDMAVRHETAVLGRRVYLDYTTNPSGAEKLDFSVLCDEAHTYLVRAGACFGRPIDRLLHMNAPAVELYASKGVDLTREPLEIALCAQHNNGGLAVDSHWQTGVPGLYVCGEAAGTHGVIRPGGSALNAGQVGALRAAQSASARNLLPMGEEDFLSVCAPEVRKVCALLEGPTGEDAARVLSAARRRMSFSAAALREESAVRDALEATERDLSAFPAISGDPLTRFRLRDTLLTQKVYLTAMLDYIQCGLPSRGSALVLTPDGEFPYRTPNVCADRRDEVQTVFLSPNGTVRVSWRSVRPLVLPDKPFETVWREYREGKR